jgi:hypothetical protein
LPTKLRIWSGDVERIQANRVPTLEESCKTNGKTNRDHPRNRRKDQFWMIVDRTGSTNLKLANSRRRI